MYFCHPMVGIVRASPLLNDFTKLVGPGVPEFPLAICVDNGRLCVIDKDFMYWSAQSNGADFEPRIAGAGFQLISDRVSGYPITLHSYSKGVLTFTTGGVMQSGFTGDDAVYRHRAINTEYRPINSFCTAQMDDNTVVVLDERGLFASRGEAPEPLAPLFNEFLIEYIRKNDLKIGQNIRLEWDNLRRLMYISVSTTFSSALYERAFVLYPPLDKWGSFDEPHYGIMPITINMNDRKGDYCGFVGSDQRLRYWIETGSRQAVDGSLLPLDASIQIGLIRFNELTESNDQMIEVQQIMIGNATSGPSDVVALDFNLIPEGQDEDYNIALGAEDFGENRLQYVNHKIRFVGTIDGQSAFDIANPQLTVFTKASRYYACTCQGVWHMLELSADEVGEFFHCRAFELTATYAGKIS
jgi:hypothetical protein